MHLYALLATLPSAPNAAVATETSSSWWQQPVVAEFVGPFMVLVLLISVVAGALKQDKPLAILGESAKLFLVLTVGFVIFCLSLYLLGNPNAPFE